MNEEATRKYYEKIIEIDKEIEVLKSRIAEYNQKNGKINWAHVGDMHEILSKLKQLNEMEN